jgi:putative sigma-54 modulation protein
MEILVRGKGVVVTDAMREYAVRKVGRLVSHFDRINSAHVLESVEGKTQKVEVQLDGDGILLRGEDRGDDLYAAVDRVVDKLERQIRKYKDRNRRSNHRGGHEPDSIRAMGQEDRTEDAPVTGRIVRSKRFAIKPVPPSEAVAQMELLSHDFFVFENAETGEVNVLYRRDDGNYGLLEPER